MFETMIKKEYIDIRWNTMAKYSKKLLIHGISNKQIKGGYLLRYRRGFFCKGWSEEWVVLYEDSTIAWFADKGLSRPRGRIRISEAPELLAVGEWTRKVPKKPRFSRSCHVAQLLAIGTRVPEDVYWLMAQSPAEVNDWMTAISNTLPHPPHLPLEDKHLTLSSQHQDALPQCRTIANGKIPSANGHAGSNCTTLKNKRYEDDHTVIAGVVNWGHGWGWGHAALAAETAAVHEAAISSTLYCHATEDYSLGGYDEVDWSAFGDFCF